ncbi:MAG: glycosyltransferase [Flavobacteriales bacterium]|nr:glycosyltransferase [Flavobacteriales bacterium]
MDYPIISIITPSFNQGAFIEETLRSCIDQNYPNLELIVIDGGSTDQSVDIIKQFSGHIKYWVSERDEGQSHAINKGIQKSTGEIINWVNSDDWLEGKSLFTIANYFQDSNTNILCGKSRIHNIDQSHFLKRTSSIKPPLPSSLASSEFMQPSTFWRASIFKEFTPLKQSLHYMMDHDIWTRYIMKYGFEGIQYCDEVLSNIRMHEAAKSVGDFHKFGSDKLRIMTGVKNSFQKSSVDPKSENPLEYVINKKLWSSKDMENLLFYVLFRRVFKYNHLGQRRGPNFATIGKLIVSYPLKTLYNIFAKFHGKTKGPSYN